jgi:hypothetical protein
MVYEERFELQSGPLRPAVVRSGEAFLSCGRLQGGLVRIRCPKCRKEHLLAFSYRTRNFCSSCQAKRSIRFAEKLAGEILAPVPHRHWTFSIPRVLRGPFERERSLLGLLSQTAANFACSIGKRYGKLHQFINSAGWPKAKPCPFLFLSDSFTHKMIFA